MKYILWQGDYSDKGVTAVVDVPRELTADDNDAFRAWLITEEGWAACCLADNHEKWLDPKEPAAERWYQMSDMLRSFCLKVWLCTVLGGTELELTTLWDGVMP